MDLNSRLITLGSGSAAGEAAADYWILLLEGDQTDDVQARRVKCGTNNQSFAIVDNQNKLAALSIDSDGSIAWKKQVSSVGSNTPGSMSSFDINVDSSDNVYVVGSAYKGPVSWSNNDAVVVKYNSSGVMQWGRRYGDASYSEQFNSVAIDSSGDVICHGKSSVVSGGGLLSISYSSSGSIITSNRKVWGSTSTDPFESKKAFIFSNGDIGVIAQFRTAAFARYYPLLMRITKTSTNNSWTKRTGTQSVGNMFAFGGAMDSSENLILATRDPADLALAYLLKCSSSGSFTWEKNATMSNINLFNYVDAAADSSDNLYVVGYVRDSSTSVFSGIFVKYNSSGVVQWARKLSHSNTASGSGFLSQSVDLDSDGNIVVVGYIILTGDSEYSAAIIKVPSDGSLTGTYGDFTYSAVTLVEGTRSYGAVAETFNVYSDNETNSSMSSYTFGDASFSSTSLTTL